MSNGADAIQLALRCADRCCENESLPANALQGWKQNAGLKPNTRNIAAVLAHRTRRIYN